MQRYAASQGEDKGSIQPLETDDSDENMIRLTGLFRRLCAYFAQLPLVLLQDYTYEVLRKSTALLEACWKALKESTCIVQIVQELAHEATLNFSLNQTISAMMTRIGDVVQSTGKTAFARQSCSSPWHNLVGRRCDRAVWWRGHGCRSARRAGDFLQTTCRFEIGGGTQGTRAHENRETRVAAEFESDIHGPCHIHCEHSFRFLVGCRSH